MRDKPLRVERLTKVFRVGSIFSREKFLAVEGVSFEINPAEVFTLAGESGCGKTTVAKLIFGFLQPNAGNIYHKNEVAGIKKQQKMEFLNDVQAIYQDPFETFNPLRKASNYLYETAINFGVAEDQKHATKIVRETLEAVGLHLEEVKGKYPGEFSGGQLQRMSVARALITNPSLLIADEPVSMVDASLRMSIVNLFKELKDRYKISILYITHDLATAYYVSDRIAIMIRGNIVEIGPIESVLMDPKHPYTTLLKESIPQPDPKERWTKRVNLRTLEKEEYQMEGCKFAGRCPHVMGVCRKSPPDGISVDGRTVKCYLYY